MSNTGIYESDSEPARSRYGDSDEESLVDVDSPADGYFERRQHPQTPFVPNPATQQARSEEEKAREAAAERWSQQQRHEQQHRQRAEASGTERQRPPSHHSQPRSPVWAADEDTPLLDAGPAGPPPDYAAATADRRGGHGREGSYGSISDSAFSSDHPLVRNGLLGEHGVFGQSRSEPQSMRDSTVSERGGLRGGGGEVEVGRDEEVRGGRGFVRRRWDRDWNGRRRCVSYFRGKRLLTWLAIIATVVLILLFSGVFEDVQDNAKHPSAGNGRQTPEPAPAAPGHDDDNDDHDDHDDPTTDSPLPPHKSSTQCPYRTFSTPEAIHFQRLTSFSLLEFIENPSERAFFNDHVTGTIRLSAGAADQKDDVVVWVSVALSGSMDFERLRKVTGTHALELLFPDVSGYIGDEEAGAKKKSRWSGTPTNCLDFSVALLVRPGIKLESLEVDTGSFDVEVAHGVFDDSVEKDDDETADSTSTSTPAAFQALDSASITAVRGKVHAAYLSSRRTYIETTSSSISGTYALRDVLSIKSTSGSIDISVDPKPASAAEPEHPADFVVKSNSGSVDVGYLTDSIGGDPLPTRDYQVRVETTSASVKGSYVFGSSARFDTNSGQLDVSLLPYDAAKAGTLHTSSGSAQTKLRLLSPYTSSSASRGNTREGVLGHLRSTHESRSGALTLTYPDEWEGVVDGESTSGSIKVRGEDVEMLLDEDIGKGLPGGRGRALLRHVTARKGYGDSKLNFATTSGGVDVLVGHA